jgi:choline kinase
MLWEKFGIPPNKQQIWTWKERPNKTNRVQSILTAKDETSTSFL